MTKTLTEQWCEGTLADGFYYMQDYTGRYCYRYLLGVKPDADFVKCFKEVLAPVPSYDEYKRLEKKLEIATKSLEFYAELPTTGAEARQALKEMEGVK